MYPSFRQFLNEGGNVFRLSSEHPPEPIKREHIAPTLKAFQAELARWFPTMRTSFATMTPLGSVGKKPESGDIDVSYDAKYFMPDKEPNLTAWGLNPTTFAARVAQHQKRARTSTLAQLQLRAMIEMVGERLNDQSDLIEIDTKAAGRGSLFASYPQFDEKNQMLDKRVQIDVNVGLPEWLAFSYYSEPYTGNVKGLHRTQLLVALSVNKGKMFKHELGVMDKDTRELIAQRPEEFRDALSQMYGIPFDLATMNNFHKLYEFLKRRLTPQDFNNTRDIYLRILDSTRTDIPDELVDYWKQHQTRLGLTGKFLPDSSKLAPYRTEKA